MATKTKTSAAAAVRTPSAIAVEEAAAHHSEYDPTVPLTDIEAHPNNVRRDAIADDELVASIRAGGVYEPIVVAPHPDPDGPFKWRLIMGHRRKDGSEKAGHTSIPSLIRYDLVDEADQVAAMLVENGRRTGLSPIEEADGFDLLTELGWDVERIATTYGCSAATVKARRKLTSLKLTFQEQVSAGQVTLDDALLIASLPAKEQQRLEKVAPDQMRYQLALSQGRVRTQRELDTQIKTLRQLGGTEQKIPKGAYFHALNDADHGLTPLSRLDGGLRTADAHTGCIGWVDSGTAEHPSIGLVCTNVSGHDDEIAAAQAAALASRTEEQKKLDDDRATRTAEEASRREEHAAAVEARHVAARLRGDVVLEATRKVKIPPVLAPLLRAALIHFGDLGINESLYQDLAGVPENLRWTHMSNKAYLDTVPAMKPDQLWRCFVAALVAHTEELAGDATFPGALDEFPWQRIVLGAYLDELVTAGHQLTPPDEELQQVLAAGADETEESS